MAAVLTGCARHAEQPPQAQVQTKPEVKPAPATPIEDKREELGGPTWEPDWDRIVEEALPPELLSRRVAHDVRPFCPRFNLMSEGDKRAYWAYFFQALAAAEAGLKPTTDVRHTEPEVAVKDSVTKQMVRSEGLLQLTYMDAERYGCDFDWEKDKQLQEKDPAKTILQPRNNLTCGVKILDNQLIAQGRPLLSRFSYWSTLQPARPSDQVFLKQMKNVPVVCRRDPSLDKVRATPATQASQVPARAAATSSKYAASGGSGLVWSHRMTQPSTSSRQSVTIIRFVRLDDSSSATPEFKVQGSVETASSPSAAPASAQ